MSRVYSCIGRYASTPYTIKKTHIHVYCVEELCFYIRENAYFIDDDFFDGDMLVWLEEECGLNQLAKRLRSKLRQIKNNVLLVTTLFEETGYCQGEQLDATIAILKSNANMSEASRLKLRGDFFLKNDKYTLALECYTDLCKLITKEKDKPILAAAYHNLGVVYARLFMFENAGEYFRKAYSIVPKESYMEDFLATLRFSYTDDVYLKKLNVIDGAYDYSAGLEERVNKINAQYVNSDEYMRIKGLEQLGKEKSAEGYQDKAKHLLDNIKDEYRNAMEK